MFGGRNKVTRALKKKVFYGDFNGSQEYGSPISRVTGALRRTSE
jgi:hypothetical protein